MSLLMQALKKAERAKQNNLHEEELEKPSEAYDQVLELAPADDTPIPSARQAQPPPSFDTADTLSLEPMQSSAPPPPPQPEPSAEPRAEKRAETPPPKPRPSHSSRASAPPRSAISIDPATMRLAVLLGILLLVVAVMGYWYWRASSSPGAGANLPGVPMPLSDAPGASSTGPAAPIVVVAPSAPEQEPAPVIHHEERLVERPAVHAEPAPPPAPPRIVPPDTSNIKVLRTDTAPRINPGVQQAYQALNDGQLASARQQYETVLNLDASNRDALLGLASVALREQQGAQAAALYVRLLEINPDDGVALAGLIGLRQGDVVQSESKLKAILAHTPDSGPVLFALGNVYAKQRRWPEAQQQFFRAYSAVPGNPDYAFNLAVGLDQLNQPKMAASYYARALALAQAVPAAFNQAAAQARLRELGGAPATGAGDAAAGIVITRQE